MRFAWLDVEGDRPIDIETGEIGVVAECWRSQCLRAPKCHVEKHQWQLTPEPPPDLDGWSSEWTPALPPRALLPSRSAPETSLISALSNLEPGALNDWLRSVLG